MTLYEELKARGLIAQVTNEEEIARMINNGKATFYIGFDCTADSLTAGHFMALTLMKRLQMAGNKPVALIGGGTTMIGDPSGRTDMRKMLTREDIEHNAECFKRQMERFIDFSDGKAIMVNNADWLLSEAFCLYDDRPGVIATIARRLADAGINIATLSLADTTDFGIVRMIADDHVRGVEALKAAGFLVRETEVVMVSVPDSPGGMADMMARLDNAGINIEYSYAYALGQGDKIGRASCRERV